jgi:serine/threonine protein kinase/tetratricopeptide (TPR) repeat protein
MSNDASTADRHLWRRARALFLEASTLPAHARDAFLQGADADDEVIAAVHRLLAMHDSFTGSIGTVEPQTLTDSLDASLGQGEPASDTAIAEFRIERLLGEGGMGRVYLAVRDVAGTMQRVALKIAPLASYGRRLVELLRRERAILAGLDHPNIARFIDAGELPDGRPYFAMDYVDGVPVTRHCDENTLALRERLALFLDICDAVAYAHRRLVLHRDLKASNILVDADGRARLLDFGIAKSMDAAGPTRETTLGRNYFSLRAAAPEQIRGGTTTVATDVYGLGCLLYELLSGHLPFELEGAGEDLLRRILEQPPPLMSVAAAAGDAAVARQRGFDDAASFANALRGDLDLIAARALRKDPSERYRSVDDLAADLRNVLELRPISARSSETWYRLRMLLRRHRLTTAVGIVLGIAVVAATSLSIVQSLRAGAERDRAVAALQTAQLQRDHAQKVTDFLVRAFQSSNRTQGLTRDMSAVQLVDNAAATLQQNSDLAPTLRATLAQTLSHLFYLLQRAPEAARQAELARNELARIADPPQELRVRQHLIDAEVSAMQSSFPGAVNLARQGITLAGDAATYPDGDTLRQLWEVELTALQGADSTSESLRAADTALAELARRDDYRPEHVDWIRQQRALALHSAGRFEDVRREIESLLHDLRAGGRTRDALYINALRQLGRYHLTGDNYAAALPIYEEAIALQHELYGEEQKAMPNLLMGLGNIYSGLGRADEARELFRRSIAISERVYGKSHRSVATAYYYTADLYYFRFRDFAETERLVRRSLAALPSSLPGAEAFYHQRLAEVQHLQGKLFEADYHAAFAVDFSRETFKTGDVVNTSVINAAYIKLRRFDLTAAATLLDPTRLNTVRHFDGYYNEQMRKEAEELSAFFHWNRESDGSTIVPPFSR